MSMGRSRIACIGLGVLLAAAASAGAQGGRRQDASRPDPIPDPREESKVYFQRNYFPEAGVAAAVTGRVDADWVDRVSRLAIKDSLLSGCDLVPSRPVHAAGKWFAGYSLTYEGIPLSEKSSASVLLSEA